MATRAILFDAVGTAGQRSTNTRRLFVQKNVSNEITDQLVNAYRQVRIGDPLDETTLMGPLASNSAVEEMFDAIAQAKADGGEVITGGRTRPDHGRIFVEPTIIKMATQTDIVKQDTFAPILYVPEFDELGKAIQLHNGVPQGLSSAIFTDSIRTAETFLSVAGSTAALQPSISEHLALSLEARLDEKRKLAAAVNPVLMFCEHICAGRPTRSTG